jgi:hypothetical protein
MIRFPSFRPNDPNNKTAAESLAEILFKAQRQSSLQVKVHLTSSSSPPRKSSAPTTSKEYALVEGKAHGSGVKGGG